MNTNFLIYIFVFFLGACLGSFVNVLIYRTHKNLSLIKEGSFCPKCKKSIKWYDNVPILSYLFLGGKCRFCKKKISIQYPLVELVTGLLLLASFYYHLPSGEQLVWFFLRDSILIIFLVAIFVYDLKWYLIPDRFSLPLIVFAFLANIILGYSPLDLIIGIVIGAGFFFLQFVVSKGKWIGGGDIRLGAVMGAGLGFQGTIVALFIAYMLGSVIGIALLSFGKKKWKSKLPLGVFLVPATLISLFYSQAIVDWYFSLVLF